MNVIFQYDQSAAVTAGVSNFLTEGGAHIAVITEAKFVQGKNGKKSAGLEFSISTPQGEASYISVWYQKADGQCNQFGYAIVQAMLGLTGLQNLVSTQRGDAHYAPGLEGKQIGLCLQKVLTKKQDGSDSYKFDIKIPFNPTTRQTLKEFVERTQPKVVDSWLSSLTDKDDRSRVTTTTAAAGQHHLYDNPPADAYNDDIPF